MYAFLTIYWLIFWQRFLRNPWLLCTSELATTNFPFWCWMGRKWRATDDLYYRYPACIPFLSMWYLPSILASKLTRLLSIEGTFRLYAYFILAHYLLASFIAYKVLGLFGAITLTYAGYCIKPQTPSFVYTMCWMPGMLVGGWFGILSCFMAITGGYWPILVYFIPIAGIINPICLLGILPAMIQIIPFLLYWPKSVRDGASIDRNVGVVPFWKLKDLMIPSKNISSMNGVHYPEMEMYVGLASLFIWRASWWWVIVAISILVLSGYLPSIQRIPSRLLYLLSFALSAMTTFHLRHYWPLLIIQSFLLLRNSSIYPSFPFSQWWNRPSKAYPKSDYTGYLTETKMNDYRGAFALKEAC